MGIVTHIHLAPAAGAPMVAVDAAELVVGEGIEELVGRPLRHLLSGRGGVRCEVLEGGTVRVGDAVVPLEE
ncbi:MAG: hypothetical protein KatS3mg131_3995 [Candidatus Tectimicrobiota bacterium]|nr:MAG: hypothetical protein KatS3mg131_3995 [Candidatus Tectomicrobia bacterium]